MVGTAYAQLWAEIAPAPVVHTDDTGCPAAGEPALLMAFDHVQQQQCLAPTQRSISAVLATKAGRGRHITSVPRGQRSVATRWGSSAATGA